MSIVAIRPKIYATETPELAALFEQRKTVAAQLASIDAGILKAAHLTPGYAFIKGISGGGNIRVGVIETNCIAYELRAYDLDQRLVEKAQPSAAGYKPTAAQAIAQLGEKTINSMLNGKALTPEEKRKLVVAMLPAGILDGKEPEQSQPSPAYNEDDHPF